MERKSFSPIVSPHVTCLLSSESAHIGTSLNSLLRKTNNQQGDMTYESGGWIVGGQKVQWEGDQRAQEMCVQNILYINI